jgi:tripeptide aminopeptidase
MINAIKIAADFIRRLPADRLSPETTGGHDGFVHPYVQQSGVEKTTVKLIVRDFDTAELAAKEAMVSELARAAADDFPGSRVEITVDEQYRNMRTVLDGRPEVVENAREAIRRCGLRVVTKSIRGGTDGSRLSFMGLPTPNLFAGEHNFHSRLEWVSRQDMEKAVDVIVALCQVWEQRSAVVR